MTIDERIERLEFVVAGHIEQARKDYEENRRLWREQQGRIEERDRVWDRRTAELREAWDRRGAELREEWDRRNAELRKEMAERDRATDDRIAKLVSAIGELISRTNGKPGV